jgi:hypothetical protein
MEHRPTPAQYDRMVERYRCMCGATDCPRCYPTSWMDEAHAEREQYEQTEPSAGNAGL